MKIQVSGEVEYRAEYTLRGDSVWDDAQSVMEWLANIRRMVAEVNKELAEATGSDALIGISVRVDQSKHIAYIIGESEL